MSTKFVFIMVITTLFFTSCGTQKKVIKSTTSKTVVITAPKETQKNTTPSKDTKLDTPVLSVNQRTQEYIDKFAAIAVTEMYKYNIPASITLAQGILESGSGFSDLATRSNNHFGIKCHKGWEGASVLHDDDELGECFRKYKHPDMSYEDHSLFLTSRKRYADLFKLKKTDYKGWAKGLRKAGYATDKKYPQKLINLIESYKLYQYDYLQSDGALIQETSKTIQDKTANTTLYIVEKGDTLYSIAKKYNTSVEKLKQLNDLESNTLAIGQKLVLQ
ncbi:glucosaminidase domain-containing protein [Tenacibaculum sp. UWU-22]|uniref:glucosaminidase domain-containing protein n=1 Tax=Tenacibaculum sp. UWU-22 TaxID=3234187 RepID=UPI0034DB43CA